MSRFRNIFGKGIILAFSVSAFLSCAGMEISADREVGYLVAPVLDVDVTVDDLNQTKAVDFEIESPSLTDVHFIVKDKDGNICYEGNGLWSEPLVLPVGAYTIEASVGTNGFGAPFFLGNVSGTVNPLENETPFLQLGLVNALMKVTVDESLASHFAPGDKVILNSGAYEAPYCQWFYVPSGADLRLALKGSNSAGNPAEFVYTLPSVAAKTAYDFICNKESGSWPKITMNAIDASDVWASRAYVTNGAEFSNMSSANQNAVVYEAIPSSSSDWSTSVTAVNENGAIVFKGLTANVTYQARARVGNVISDNVVEFTPSVDGLSVSAAHTYSGNQLDGTDVKTTFSKSDLVKNAIRSWAISICKPDGTVLRSDLALGTSDGSALTGTTDWPFLPVGNYKVTLTATMNDGEVITPEDILFSSEKPTFSVTATGKTTYDYALGRDLNNANAVSGSRTANASVPSQSLFEVGSSVSIAANLMDNTNYSKTVYYAAYKDAALVIATDGYVSYGTANAHSLGDVHDAFSDWRSYTLSAKVNFAGTEYEGTRTFHITGLPHNMDFRVSSAGWGLYDNCSRDNAGLHFNPTATPYANISFHVPAAMNVSLYLYPGVQLNATSYISVSHLDVKIGGKNNDEVLTAPKKFAGGKTTTTDETRVDGTLQTSAASAELKTNALVAGMWVIVPGVRIVYR